ncbi:uncharacterized protein FOMMEDRAFT_93416, partial [Fomitiporia mediterranea MF3/22]|uniref:uncharacterized protein n=1 Tax=Fomitiporia mediterranea (strain MF3/22) TaxID=694068 RepID=UPI0004409271
DTYNEVYRQSTSLELLTHLKHKLFQAVLSHILLQPEILKAYSSSILFNCLDGKLHRLFLRFAFYSADYPEKYILYLFAIFLFVCATIFTSIYVRITKHCYRMLITSLCVLGKFSSLTDIMLTKFNHMLSTRANQQRQTCKCIDDTVQ